ncbi:MAG: hypothetical protein JWM65_1292 [Sphingomonas bacterium]|nr:hypothetical protein [Sphingomonas bacterium]
MALPQLFSRRRRLEAGQLNDVYRYDQFPPKIRVQMVQIFGEGLGDWSHFDSSSQHWLEMVQIIRKEKGVFHLTNGHENPDHEYSNWILSESDVDLLLDGIELACRAMEIINSDASQNHIEELNARLQESGIGYEFQSSKIIRIDSQVIHSEVVIPALKLLHDARFGGANDEYLGAHQFFRAGDFESCLIECGKAFESVLKVVGTERGWAIQDSDSAGRLLNAAYDSHFIPQYMQAQFTALRAVLGSGVSVIRNRMSGHGAGGEARQVDRHLAAYQLHQTAAAIVFLVEHDRIVA